MFNRYGSSRKHRSQRLVTYGEGLLSKCVPILPTISHMPHGCPVSYTTLTQTSDPRHRWRQAAAASGRNQGGAEHASWGRSHDATGVKRHSRSFRREAVLGRVVPRTERSPSVVDLRKREMRLSELRLSHIRIWFIIMYGGWASVYPFVEQ